MDCDPESHKNHKLVMAEIKFHFKVWSAYVSWQHVLWLESSEDSYLYDGLALFYYNDILLPSRVPFCLREYDPNIY